MLIESLEMAAKILNDLDDRISTIEDNIDLYDEFLKEGYNDNKNHKGLVKNKFQAKRKELIEESNRLLDIMDFWGKVILKKGLK